MSYRVRLINFLIYSNLEIATAAIAMTWQTQLLLTDRFEFSDLTIFIFLATLLLYAVHRLLPLLKPMAAPPQARFLIIQSYQNWLVGIAGAASLGVLFLFFRLPNDLKILLLAPIGLAGGYTLPILPKGKRLRDLPFLKNILIAGVWTWVTAVVPIREKEMWQGLSPMLLSVGRFCFIFALSLPFDIRDMTMDRQAKVRTIPATMGIGATKILAIALNGITLACASRNFQFGFYTFGDWLGISISVLGSSILITYARPENKDWYYAGLLDSMMILQFFLVWMF